MNRFLLTGSLLVLVLAMVLAGLRITNGGDRDSGDPEANASTSSGAKSARNRGRVVSSGPARRLNRLIHAPPDQAPAIEAIERMVAELSDRELEDLRDRTAKERADGMAGWIRCSVFAEIARRDPAAAMAYLEGNPALHNYGDWALRQAWFATFRGWAEIDPAAAAARLGEFPTGRNLTGKVLESRPFPTDEAYQRFVEGDAHVRQQATMAVFEAWARSDPEAAMRAVPDQADQLQTRNSALEGIFRGLEGSGDLERVLRLLGPNQLQPMVMSSKAIQTLLPLDGPRIRDPEDHPSQQSVAAQVALTLETIEPGQGREWLETTHAGSNTQRVLIEYRFLEHLARQKPGEVLAIGNAGFENMQGLLAALGSSHLDRIGDGITLLATESERVDLIQNLIQSSTFIELEDLFPRPGRNNGLPDWRGRYENLLHLVADSDLTPPQAENLNNRIQTVFSELLAESGLPTEPGL